jgi:hypothetical protein
MEDQLMKWRTLVTALFCLGATAAMAATITYDFETDQSSQFDVRIYNTDASSDFNFVYGSYVPQPVTTGSYPIPAPPSSGGGTKALRLNANVGDAVAAQSAISIFPKDPALQSISNYTMKFDIWPNYNGPVTGGAGSSMFITFGGHSDGATAAVCETTPAQPFAGFFCGWANDTGYSQDFRYYEGTTGAPTRNDAKPNWLGTNEINAGTGWQAIFPVSAYETTGGPGKNWSVVELVVSNSGQTATMFVTPKNGTRTQVGSCSIVTGLTTGKPTIGYSDGNTSVPDGGGAAAVDNFLLIDNLTFTTTAGVTDFQLYE